MQVLSENSISVTNFNQQKKQKHSTHYRYDYYTPATIVRNQTICSSGESRYLQTGFIISNIFSNKKKDYLKTNRLILLDSVSEPFNSYWERRKHCTVLTTFNTKFCSIFYFFTIIIYALGITYIKSNANQLKQINCIKCTSVYIMYIKDR